MSIAIKKKCIRTSIYAPPVQQKNTNGALMSCKAKPITQGSESCMLAFLWSKNNKK